MRASQSIPEVSRRPFDPVWLALPGVVLLLLLVLVPCLRVLTLSVQDSATGALSIDAFHRALATPIYLRVLGNTFSIAFYTTVLCLVFGYPLAYWLARQPARRRPALVMLVLFPFWTGALVKSFIWIVVLGQSGPIAQLFHLLGRTKAPDLLFSRATVVLVMAHTMLPLAVITMLPTMLSLDRNPSRAAATMGADAGEAFWRITFHTTLPGVAATGLLVFIGSLGFFITPALVGSRRDTVLAQIIIDQIMSQQAWAFAGALSAMLIGAALVSCIAYDLVFGLSSLGGDARRRASHTLVHRCGMSLLRLLGRATSLLWRLTGECAWLGRLLDGYAIALIVLLLVPIIVCVPMAFSSADFLSVPTPGFSLRWLKVFFASETWIHAMLNSFVIGIATAVLTLVVSGLAALGVARSRRAASRAVFLLFLSPVMIPHVVIAIGLFYLFAPAGLIATRTGIALGHTVVATPLVFTILLGQLKQYDWRLNQASETMGARSLYTLRRIMLPMLKGGLFAALIFAFLSSFEELTISLFIGGGICVTLPRKMWDDINLQFSPALAAASVIVLAVVAVLFLIGEKLRPRERTRA
ncbi:ABC transporter permease subunit [Paraburkholderia sp. J41]|uniref:ABC transporter permease subunit n=1 Tax=Paraburkholderia sp. J41 TaxID=2805433 RepID=UPI002AC33A56|nr:ABC transporter permease subunit [Paraburkholderia sp. J41]